MLLWLELAAAAAATILGLRSALDDAAAAAAGDGAARPDALEAARRAAVGTLFGLHTVRFRIYLRPDQGRRSPAADSRQERGRDTGALFAPSIGSRGVPVSLP
jgi:hypothetical protein